MLLLPTFRAALAPCPVSPASFAPHPQGHFCGQCQRVVQDFTQSASPAADLAAARAAAPDGRVCGRFSAAQVTRPRLGRRLRWFLVALGLVLVQGLSACEALLQVEPEALTLREEAAPADSGAAADAGAIYGAMVFPMPELPGGGGNQAIVAAIQQRIVWPEEHGQLVPVEGRLFVSFTVGVDGRVRDIRIAKGLHPLLDAATVRAVSELGQFTPGQQHGRPEEVIFTVPVSFKLE